MDARLVLLCSLPSLLLLPLLSSSYPMPPISRRNFLHSTAAASAVALTPPLPQTQTPPAFPTLKPLGDRVHPITPDEFHARFLPPQSFMSQPNPPFHPPPIPPARPAQKPPHELELMRPACEATCDLYRAVFANLKEGMTQEQVSELVVAGYAKMHLRGDALVLFGPSAALPHGSKQPRTLKEGDVVLIDDGCTVEGYCSDVTRTGVFGKPSEKIQRAFETVRKAQDTALDAARAGKFSGSVDDAARAVITSAGYGPCYKFFAHRLGHGIGLDIHEHPYLVHASKTVLEPGMTFSNEPV